MNSFAARSQTFSNLMQVRAANQRGIQEEWDDLLGAVQYELNRRPSTALGGRSPFEVVFGQKSNYTAWLQAGGRHAHAI